MIKSAVNKCAFIIIIQIMWERRICCLHNWFNETTSQEILASHVISGTLWLQHHFYHCIPKMTSLPFETSIWINNFCSSLTMELIFSWIKSYSLYTWKNLQCVQSLPTENWKADFMPLKQRETFCFQILLITKHICFQMLVSFIDWNKDLMLHVLCCIVFL